MSGMAKDGCCASGFARSADSPLKWLLAKRRTSPKMESRCPPPLSDSNVLWWSRSYGQQTGEKHPDKAALGGFYRAIRDNQVEQVRAFVDQHPAAVFTKVFGCSQRTPLYVASFFGRHEVVKLLLRRGADKDLLCDGARPIDVAGFAAADPVDRMKVRALLQGDVCPQVMLRLGERRASSSTSETSSMFRLQIHFSERVREFTVEDVVLSDGAVVSSFSMLRDDLYVATVQLANGVTSATVHVPAEAARAAGGRRLLNASSGLLRLAVGVPSQSRSVV